MTQSENVLKNRKIPVFVRSQRCPADQTSGMMLRQVQAPSPGILQVVVSLFTPSHSSRAASPESGAVRANAPERAEPTSDGVFQPSDCILFAEDLSEGDSWTSELREIARDDVHQFAELTGDRTPLHDDQMESPFGKPVAHGLLGLGVLAGLGTDCPKASTLALVGIEEWQFTAPIFFGDRVRCRNEIVLIKAHGRRAVKVRWLRQLLNQDDRIVQQGFFTTLVGSKDRGISKPR